MKKIVFYFTLFTVLTAFVNANDFYNNEEVTMDLSILGEINIYPNLNDYTLEYIKAILLFYPNESWRQTILSSNIEPEAEITKNSIDFKWNNVKDKKLNFKTDYTIKTENQIVKIKEKINFPLSNTPKEYIPYTQPSENIDSNNKDIINLASTLAEGEDDLYIISAKLVSWVEDNIKYSLNSLTEDVSQKSSWVLLNRFGVCDELTNLYIALLRSLGIPARFISGVAYTDWNNMNNWGSHAWAEVYFPGYGWVPFDITYRQFGSLDLSHITLRESLDSNEPSTKYEWKGYGLLVEPKDLKIEVNLINKKEAVNPLISLKIKPYEENIGFGSYNIIEVEVKNLKDYYVSEELYLSSSKEVELATNTKKYIVLKPDEIKKEYWLIKLSKELDQKYTYTFPVGVNTLRNISIVSYFSASRDDIVYSRTEMQEILDTKQKETEKTYSSNVDLICSMSKKEYYIDEQLDAGCVVKNKGNTILKNLKMCLRRDCETFDLEISQEKQKTFYFNASSLGKKENLVTIENNDVSKFVRLEYFIADKPRIDITSLEYPGSVYYNDDYNITFSLVKASEAIPENIIIDFNAKGLERSWKVESLNAERQFIVQLRGKDLNVGKNSFHISVIYKDKNGNSYNNQEEFSVSLNKVNLIQRIIIFIKSLV